MRIEFKIYRRIEFSEQWRQDFATKQFVGGAYVGEGAFPKVLDLQEFAYKKIAVVHERTQLRVIGTQLLHNTRAIDDVGMGCIASQFFEVAGPECHVAFAKNHIISFALFVEFAQTAVRAEAIPTGRLSYDACAGFSRKRRHTIFTVVVHHDNLADHRMRDKIPNRGTDTSFIVVGHQRNRNPLRTWRAILNEPFVHALSRQQKKHIQKYQNDPE